MIKKVNIQNKTMKVIGVQEEFFYRIEMEEEQKTSKKVLL